MTVYKKIHQRFAGFGVIGIGFDEPGFHLIRYASRDEMRKKYGLASIPNDIPLIVFPHDIWDGVDINNTEVVGRVCLAIQALNQIGPRYDLDKLLEVDYLEHIPGTPERMSRHNIRHNMGLEEYTEEFLKEMAK